MCFAGNTDLGLSSYAVGNYSYPMRYFPRNMRLFRDGKLTGLSRCFCCDRNVTE